MSATRRQRCTRLPLCFRWPIADRPSGPVGNPEERGAALDREETGADGRPLVGGGYRPAWPPGDATGVRGHPAAAFAGRCERAGEVPERDARIPIGQEGRRVPDPSTRRREERSLPMPIARKAETWPGAAASRCHNPAVAMGAQEGKAAPRRSGVRARGPLSAATGSARPHPGGGAPRGRLRRRNPSIPRWPAARGGDAAPAGRRRSPAAARRRRLAPPPAAATPPGRGGMTPPPASP